ncbi:MAG: hypothetical protein GF311_13190, partial [Candidatus Lokiarchaeota archaeon]|nr:hypothetical protein [Candidatus Lokiarchaeota archaeon]
MNIKSVIPDKIPIEILESERYDQYEVLILYALAINGPLKREKFINKEGIDNRINKNTFHKYANNLLKQQLIENYHVGRKSEYKITTKGEDELLRRLKDYSLDFQTINKLEQERIEKKIPKLIKFLDDFEIADTEIKLEFLDLINVITH